MPSCECEKCDGADVSAITRRRHNARPRAKRFQLESFAEWQRNTALGEPSKRRRMNDPEPADFTTPVPQPQLSAAQMEHVDDYRNLDEQDEGQAGQYDDGPSGIGDDENDTKSDDGNDEPKEDPGCLDEQDRLDMMDDGHISDQENNGTASDDESDELEASGGIEATLEHLQVAQQYISLIKAATLDNGGLDPETVAQLRDPEEGPVDISDPDLRLSIDLFLAMTNSSEQTYNDVRSAISARFPDSNVLSRHLVEKRIAALSGIVPIVEDMCINSCHAFTGPFAELNECTICKEPRYEPIQMAENGVPGKKISRQRFTTIPLGPQIQALRRSPKGSAEMAYRVQKTKQVLAALENLDNDLDMVYDDIFCGSEYLDLLESSDITDYDVFVSNSLDGCQLYKNKQSDVWIYIWIIDEITPGTRYKKKHVRPGGFISGPNKPKIVDSFLFRGLHHVSALQRENNGRGMKAWDFHLQRDLGREVRQPSNPFANLAQRGVLRAQVNALKAMCPELDTSADNELVCGALDIGNGYILLRARDRYRHTLSGDVAQAVQLVTNSTKVVRWARLQLPNGQVARSAWKEKPKPLNKVRIARMVQICVNDSYEYGEAQFYFQHQGHTFALLSMFSPPDDLLREESYGTLWVCSYLGLANLRVVDAKLKDVDNEDD
ncbi:hypothetical protein EYR38_009918 [Pleurotus pulmonarius]|nr:hypothetical protein EYR38_009918 [Pleurotus pulmonarius]